MLARCSPAWDNEHWCDRTEHGGGVAVWVKSNLAYRHLDDIPTDGFEVIWLSIATAPGEQVIMYRPGSCPGNDLSLIQYLDSTLDLLEIPGTRIILAGDCNVNNKHWLKSTKTTAAGELL